MLRIFNHAFFRIENIIYDDIRGIWSTSSPMGRRKDFNHRFFVCSQQRSLPRIYLPFHLAESSQTFSKHSSFARSREEKDCVIRTANNSGSQLLHAEQKGYDACKRKLLPVKLNRIRSLNGDRTIVFHLRLFLPRQILSNFASTSNPVSRNKEKRNWRNNPREIISIILEKWIDNDSSKAKNSFSLSKFHCCIFEKQKKKKHAYKIRRRSKSDTNTNFLAFFFPRIISNATIPNKNVSQINQKDTKNII